MYSDAGQFRLGGQFGGKGGHEGVERLGGLCGYGVLAGRVVGDGDLL